MKVRSRKKMGRKILYLGSCCRKFNMVGTSPEVCKSLEMNSHLQRDLMLVSPYVLMLLPT